MKNYFKDVLEALREKNRTVFCDNVIELCDKFVNVKPDDKIVKKLTAIALSSNETDERVILRRNICNLFGITPRHIKQALELEIPEEEVELFRLMTMDLSPEQNFLGT